MVRLRPLIAAGHATAAMKNQVTLVLRVFRIVPTAVLMADSPAAIGAVPIVWKIMELWDESALIPALLLPMV